MLHLTSRLCYLLAWSGYRDIRYVCGIFIVATGQPCLHPNPEVPRLLIHVTFTHDRHTATHEGLGLTHDAGTVTSKTPPSAHLFESSARHSTIPTVLPPLDYSNHPPSSRLFESSPSLDCSNLLPAAQLFESSFLRLLSAQIFEASLLLFSPLNYSVSSPPRQLFHSARGQKYAISRSAITHDSGNITVRFSKPCRSTSL